MALRQNDGGRNQYPRFQLWRPNGPDRYEREYESSTDSSRFMTTDNSGLTIAEYVPPTPISFQAGDVLGVYQPDIDDRRLSVIHASVPPGFGRVNYVGGTDVVEFSTVELSAYNDFPLVAVNTSKNHNILIMFISGGLYTSIRPRIIIYTTNTNVHIQFYGIKLYLYIKVLFFQYSLPTVTEHHNIIFVF